MNSWTSLASLMGAFAFFQSIIHTVLPHELRFAIDKLFRRLFYHFSPYCYFDITDIDGFNTNELYNAVQFYLNSSASFSGSRLSLTRAPNSSAFTFGLSNSERIVDTFEGATAVWEHVVTQRQSQAFSLRPLPEEKRHFTLRMKKKDRALILEAYLNHIMEKAAELQRKNQDRHLYTNSRQGSMDKMGKLWESVPFKHPSTFTTLAIDPVRKEEIMADLKAFAEGKAFYERTGRAWKRGYRLYGPPGTGKSSMIAATANFLGYDIYDLELTEVQTNSDLRKLLMRTTPKSIIVIEDIDCSIDLTTNRISGNGAKNNKEKPYDNLMRAAEESNPATNSVTLSGLLNFTDGLWSCCGSERILIFTTNYVEKLDPALLRSGRMDMHILMSYCSFLALRVLLNNYLGLEDEELLVYDGLMREIEEVIEDAEMTPADISEVLIKNRRCEKERAMRELLEVLRRRAQGKKRKNVGGEEGRKERVGPSSFSSPSETRCGSVFRMARTFYASSSRLSEEKEEEKIASESPTEGMERLEKGNVKVEEGKHD